MNSKVEIWNVHKIRFVEKETNEWWAVAKDVCDALGLNNSRKMISALPKDLKDVTTSDTLGGKQKVNIVSELGIYKLVFKSRREEAEAFQEWIFATIKQMRQSSGLEGFQIFRMLDKEHQREMMSKLSRSLEVPGRPDFIKANTIANKAVSSKFGHPKMLKKEQMTPAMIVERQSILDDTVDLMAVADKFGLKLSVSDTIYSKHTN